MRKSLKVTLFATLVLSLSACSNLNSTQKVETTSLTDGQLAGQQLVSAVAWVQNSGEYRALAYQAFNFATISYQNAPVVKGKGKAVIVDLDETMIDNSDYQGGVVKSGVPFNNTTWGKWEQAGNPKAIPGAVAFAQYVAKNGGTMFYISNRQEANLAHTIETLKALGFPGVSSETVLLQSQGGTSSKDPRFDKVNAKYNVVLYIGDNLTDYPQVSNLTTTQARNAWVEQNANKFGIKYVILPNPMYGNWVSALAPNFYKNSLSEQNKLKVDAIRAWDLTNYK
ncbi:5'-nucleotidase, lipoprotein e(P4) family [Psittacicella gerlachiana]|uniref:5'-nucleotidase, lipoprotein e(P4) family n=1 Tax=Psittacicella gerlachiana TaxID=2028574 RepID=A0A3A1YB33_9GAMM|nr:5'-nucleotidase, lipoprotein e(P4) family [Psittacicella gerlachiana]RIY33327.1 5'-nucleotidase, lipoprotein e(P4) family [Psittacicella gerlachiana]